MKDTQLNTYEEWKIISEFPKYEVSNLGNVRNFKTKHILKPRLNKQNGYLVINLMKDGKKHTKTLHRLVAITFLENLNNLPEVNHIDGNKRNNKMNNLEWCTRSYNKKHCYKMNLRKSPKSRKHSDSQIKEIRRLYKRGVKFNHLRKIYNIGSNTLSMYLSGLYKPKPRKLSPDIQKKIVELYNSGEYTYDEIGNKFNIGSSCVYEYLRKQRVL